MASINLDKVRDLYGNSTDLQGQFVDYLRNIESELDFSKFEGLDNQAIFTNLMESGQKEIKVNPNNPAKPLDYRPRREQTYKELKPLDDELKNQPFYKDLAMRATQVLDQINPTPFRQKELETRRHKAQEILNHLKKSGVTSEQFAKEYGDSPFLREAYFENQDIFSNIFDLSHDTSAALFGGKNAQAKAYDFELESYNTYKTIAQRKLDNPSSYYKLSPKERAIIEQRVGAIGSWWRNNSDKELVDHYLDLENAKERASNFVSAQKRLENVNSNEQFLGLIGALKHGKEFDKKQKAMIDDYAIVAKELGFDTLAYNKTGLYFIKDEKAYKVEQGLWDEIKGVFKDNIGSLAGAIAGAEYGYKKGKFKGMVIYGAAGAFGGGVTDSMIADVLANKKIDLAQALLHGAQEGALNIAADAVLKVAGTAIKTLNPEKLKNIAGTAIDYTPLLGFAKRAKDGNKAAAQKLIDHAIPQEAQADLKALESIFGAEVQIGTTKTSQAQSAIRTLESKLGSDSYIVKGAKSLYDTFAFTSQKQAQKDFIRAIRADESGNLSAFLSEAANASPVIQKNLLDILHQTSQKLAHQLGRFDLPPSTIKDVFDNFEKGTKQSYTDAIEQILLKVYDESYTTTLAKDSPNIPSNLSSQEAARFNTDSLEDFKAKMEKSGVLLEDSAKFLRFVESTIYNPKGVTFETLNNAQKTLNAYYKQATDPNFRSFVKDAVNGFIKRDIQAGIEKIFAQNAPLYNDARTLFDTALSDYAKMKETLKLADSLKIRDHRRSYDQVAQSLSRFFLGQGDNIPNFEALLGGLQKELREQVELKLLQDMLELSFVKLNDIKVLDSSEFFKRLEPLKGHFHSTSAKDFIKIAQDFHTLFRNDASIARSLSPATTEKIGTSIATTLEGAIKFQVIKALFANVVRLLPHIPFAKGLNEKVQGAALRFHLKKALDSSLSVGEFKLELQARAIKGDFTNATREQIAKILGQVDSAQESLEQAITPSTQAKPNLHPIDSQEAKELAEHFHFKGAKPLVREARENEIAHALKSHGDETTEAQRGNIAITRADIETNYPKITQDHDEKFYTDTGVIYVKQVNGHHIAIEEALLGQDKLIFKTMWKTKGNYNKEVLLKNAKASPYPHNADEAAKSKSISNPSLEQGSPLQSHQSTSNSTTQNPLEQAITPSTQPKQLDSSLKTSEIKQELLQRLEPILNKPLTNAQGVQAYINHASIDKMLSDKAIAKSVENGFSKQEHLEAVGDIERLFSISQEAATHSHKGDNPSVIIHRLNAPFNNANALITTKESLDKDKNRIYSVELELTPRFDTPARPTDTEASKGSSSSLNGQGGQDSPTIAKADQNNSTTLSPLEQAQAQKRATQEAQEAAQAAQAAKDEATAQAIKDRNDQIQHLKDSRAGKGEMEREIKIGEPIAMQRTEQPPTSIATDDNNIYQLDFVIVKARDVKPNFNADGLQPRTQKEHKTIESIARDFKPEMVLGRGGYKDLPIIAKDGQVITGNHRVQGFKDFTRESRAAYEKAIKDRFNIELASDELLLRTPSDDLSVKELLSIAYNSNKEDIKNLGDHIYSVLGRYAPNFAKLPRQLESTSVQELKSKIARILDNSPYPNENDANLALLANTIKADKNATIIEMLNSFSKLDKEDAARTLNTFTDTAGLWHILSNNAVEYGLKQLDLRPYLLGAMYKSAVSQHTTRAANFKELNAQIKHILDTTDSSGSNMMLEIMPNTYDNLIADLLGASLARFMRLENPSANLYEALKGANSGIREQLAPRLDFETGFTTGRNIEQADIFDFIEYLIRDGGEGKEVAEAVELLPKLREKYNAFKASTPPPNTPTPPTPPKDTLESQAEQKSLFDTQTPAETPPPKVDSSDLPLKPATAQEAKELIESITPAPMPAHLSEQEFLEGFEHFINKENFLAHLHKAQDSKQRIEALNLVEPTRKNADIELETINAKGEKTKEFIKVFEGENKRKFYVLVTQADNENFLLTGIPTTKLREIRKRINNAKEIKARDSGVVSSAQSHNKTPTPSADSTTKTFNQAQTPPREIPEQDLPYKRALKLKEELQTLKPLKRELSELKSSGKWRTKEGRTKRKELENIIKETEERGITPSKIEAQEIKDYEEFLQKYGDQEYFKELAQKTKELHIYNKEQSIRNHEQELNAPLPSPNWIKIVIPKEQKIKELDDFKNRPLDIDGEIFNIASEIVRLKNKLIDFTSNFGARRVFEKALGIKPIAEFGENYAEYYRDGKGAIEKLIAESQAFTKRGEQGEYKGQIAGAFHRKELGDIDVVWGEITDLEKHKGYGLAHILDKRKAEFMQQGLSEAEAEAKALEFAKNEIADIIENGKITSKPNEATKIETQDYKLILKQNWSGEPLENKWLVTAYIKKEKGESISSTPFTKGDNLPLNSSEIIPQPPQKSLFDTPKLESTLNNTLESYKAHETATTQLKRSIFEKENELKDLVAEKEKVEQWAETIKEQGNSRALTKIAKELEKIGFDTFSKHPMLDYEVSKVKKVNPRLEGQEFYDESTIINFKDLKKFIKSRDDFIKFKDKLDTLYLADSPYGNARYVNKIKDFNNTKQAGFYQAFSESNYDNIIKELIDKEASKIKNIDNDKIISLQKELEQLKEQLENTNQSLAQSAKELEQIPFLQKLFNNKPLFNDFLTLRFNTMSEKELKKQAQKALIDIDTSRSYFEKTLNITPIKEFGTNYAEHYHSGESAIQKLLLERNGQVSGAFHRKELGDIDVVWGEVQGKGKEAKGWGLAKIIEKHGDEFENIAKELDEIIRDGEVVKTHNGYNIELGDYKVGLNIGWNENGVKIGENKWVVTAFDKSKLQSEKQGSNSASLTKGETLPFNSSDIIPQTTQAKQSGKSVAETKELIDKNKELKSINTQKIQEIKEKIKQLNKESRDLAYNAPTPKYLGKGYTKTRDKKYLDYRSRFSSKLKENGIYLDYMKLEKLKQDTTLKGKARKEAMDTIYLRMYENMQQADKEAQERTRAFSQKIREEELQEANEWLEKNKGASSDVDYEYKRKIAEIDKQLDLAFKKNTKDTEFIDLMNRQRGTLTYAKNGDLGVVRLPELEKFYPRGYPMVLKVLQDIQKEHNYTDKNLILNGRDFSKSFEVMRAEIEARIGIKPIKEFDTNYAEHYHSGESAIAKLLNEKQGQVAGAFWRKELGDIDLVWGDSSKGLEHIIERRKQDFIEKGFSEAEAEQKALEFVKSLPDIIENGNIDKGTQRVFLDTENERAVIALDYNGIDRKWVLTGYIKDDKAPISAYPHQNKLTDSTSSPIVKSALTDEIIPQPPQKSLFDTQAPAETQAPKVDSSKITIAQEPTEPKTLSPQEAKELLESKQGQRLPQELDIQSFLKSLESVENKENFIAHLQKKDDAQSRLAYLHIVEPTLKTPDIELTKGERKTKIKVFNDGENFYSFLIADLADKRLFTFLPKARKGYIETKIKNADLIQTFTSQASKDQEPNGLARHSIAQDSNALLESTSTPTPSQPPQAQRLKEALQIPLTDDRGLQSLAFGRVGSDAEIMEQVLIPQARNAYRKGTSQNKLEVAARNTLKKHRQDLEQSLNITPIKEFGTNYAEHYHSGESAIQKLLLERNGQVSGAFYRDDIGDITLAWGEKGTGKSDGWGLAKIAEYHSEVLDKLDKLIQDLPIVKETENRYKLDNGDFFISIRKDFDGEKQNWVLTALERDESIARRRTDLPSSQSEAEKTTSANASADSTTKTFN